MSQSNQNHHQSRPLGTGLIDTEGTMHRLIISAPFGNYIQPKNTTPTIGTFTLHNRPGRLKQIIKTVRYFPSLGAWTNKIGLRNPGIDSVDSLPPISDKILSIHGFNEGEWMALFEKVAFLKNRPMAVELNLSCPNVIDEQPDYGKLCKAARESHPLIIVKIPPFNYQTMIFEAFCSGVNMFHCTNTMPVPVGGMSGKPLKRFALDAVVTTRRLISSAVIIGGGGITTTQDIDDYVAAGANYVAIGSGLFNPWRALYGVNRLAQHATKKCS